MADTSPLAETIANTVANVTRDAEGIKESPDNAGITSSLAQRIIEAMQDLEEAAALHPPIEPPTD